MTLDMLSRLEPTSQETRDRHVVKFKVDDILCAVDIMHVREIIQPTVPTSLPNSPDFIIGVADHRQVAIPVVDLRIRLGVPASPFGKSKWIIVSISNRAFILAVDNVLGVGIVNKAQERLKDSIDESSSLSWTRTVYGTPDGLMFEVDLGAIVNTNSNTTHTP